MNDPGLRDLEAAVLPGRWSYRRNGDALYLNNGSFGIAAAVWREETEKEFALIVAMRNALGRALHGDAFDD